MVKLDRQNRKWYITQILGTLHLNKNDAFRQLFLELHPTDQVDILLNLSKEERKKIYRHLSPDEVANMFKQAEIDEQVRLFAELPSDYAVEVINNMYADDVADFLDALPQEVRQAYLQKMNTESAIEVQHLLTYPKHTVGSLMTTEFLSVWDEHTVQQVMEFLRTEAPNAETIYYLYVVDEKNRLVGVISLRDLIIAQPEQKVKNIMNTNVIFVDAHSHRKEVAEIIQKYDFLALPVTEQGKLVGIVTFDDVMDALEERETESFHKMGTATTISKSLKEATIGYLYRKRISWLVLLVFFNIFSGAGIAFFEDTIAQNIALVFFLPLLVDSGGNAGSQSATLMIRALATGDIRIRDWAKLFVKEISIAALLGVTMALAVSLIGLYRGGIEIAIVVSLSMFCVVIVGSLIGMSLPFIFSRFKLDPATASAPLITSLADMIGVVIYFSIATLLLTM
ncbi:magnesium transporter [Anoxybacillus ayderensis]|uniref:magnesium transporter n=1 Tax=Anoxybacillus ayderensis TaxID=265546 RepID=UPI000A26A111|nr:magnesium transporter [Anoxybacillus ayderensis]MED0657553.1 magnesium transporter [Anoxybacillus ayderensis]OSX54719.1 magnesium transporter [Anoxybacillus ayderensis]